MKNNKIIIIVMIITITLSCFLTSYSANKYKVGLNGRDFYQNLTLSLTKGHLYIDEKIDEKLKELSNPYDPMERVKNHAHGLHDYSFYNNHYYVYFGIVPVLITTYGYLAFYNHYDGHLFTELILPSLLILSLSVNDTTTPSII